MIVLTDVSKTFSTGTIGLDTLNLEIDKGEFVFLVGHTGSGKTTLLRLLIREYLPSSGVITIEEVDISKLPKNKIPALRSKIGVVFQDLKLLNDKTILENVLLPFEIRGSHPKEALNKALELLEKVGIMEHKDKFPIQLSGGELQRAAIARALTLDPLMILADEPTGNLDSDTAFGIVELLDTINKAAGTTIIMATHNLEILKKYPKNRVIKLDSGKMISDSKKNGKNEKEKLDEEKMENVKEAKEKVKDKHEKIHPKADHPLDEKNKDKKEEVEDRVEHEKVDEKIPVDKSKHKEDHKKEKNLEDETIEKDRIDEEKPQIKKGLFGGKLAERFKFKK